MRDAVTVKRSLLYVLCLALGLQGAYNIGAAGDQQQADNRKAVRIVLKSVRVTDTNAQGKSWDINDNMPEVVVRIKNKSNPTIKEFASAEKANALDLTYDAATILALPGQQVQIEVVDKDLALEDLIGRKTFTLTQQMIDKGSQEVAFDQVKSLVLEFRTP